MKKWLAILVMMILFVVVASAQTDEGTATPTAPATPAEAQATPTTAIIEPLLGLPFEPPITIALPESWELVLLDTYIYRDIMSDPASNADGPIETVPIAVYSGPISVGQGWIVMLWGYDSIVTPDTSLSEYEDRALWLDGLRLLQFVVFDVRCNIGTAPQREYTIGQYPATGTTFSAVDCPFGWPDTRGWFAALEVEGLPFAFYVYADPILPPDSQAVWELQAILDTVEFHVDDIIVSRDDFEATREAILTPQAEITVEATAEATAAAGQ